MLSFYMPTKVIFEKHAIKNHPTVFNSLGKHALIVMGKHSAYENGAFKDIVEVLNNANVSYEVFDRITENPSLELLDQCADFAREFEISFIIAIGGGSPLDAAKGIAVLINNPHTKAKELLEPNHFRGVPLVAIPTTAGTGSETTPYAIFTDHQHKTKVNYKCNVFPDYAIIDTTYYKSMPLNTLRSTAVDALTHMVEGYLAKRANPMSDFIAEKTMETWAKAKQGLIIGDVDEAEFEALVLSSTYAGMVIAQTGTSLPHGLGYNLTYFHNVPHGKATAVFMGELLKIHQNKVKVDKILSLLDFDSIQSLKDFLNILIGEITIEEVHVNQYVNNMNENKAKLLNHPYDVTAMELEQMIRGSLKIV